VLGPHVAGQLDDPEAHRSDVHAASTQDLVLQEGAQNSVLQLVEFLLVLGEAAEPCRPQPPNRASRSLANVAARERAMSPRTRSEQPHRQAARGTQHEAEDILLELALVPSSKHPHLALD